MSGEKTSTNVGEKSDTGVAETWVREMNDAREKYPFSPKKIENTTEKNS